MTARPERLREIPPCFQGRRTAAGILILAFVTSSCVWMEPVSVDASGVPAGAIDEDSAISRDGRYISFASEAALLPTDTNFVADVYRYDIATGAMVLVSTTTSGISANAASGEPDISDDGDIVAFISAATDLWPGANGLSQVYVRRISSGTTALASVASDGTTVGDGNSAAPSLARDGSVVAFASTAGNLSPGDSNGVSDIFSYDIAGAAVTRRTDGLGGAIPNGASTEPASNASGSTIAFTSEASNLVIGDTNGIADVFTVSGPTIVRISSGVLGEANGTSGKPSIAADTNTVAFASDASNLVDNDNNGVTDVFIKPQGGSLQRLSQNGAFEYALASAAPSISATGVRVAFMTDGSNIDHPAGMTAVIADLAADNVDALATQKSSDHAIPATHVTLSADGAMASFSSPLALDENDSNGLSDIYTRYTYSAYIWPRTLSPGTVARGTTSAVTISGHGFEVGGPLPVITIRDVPSITFANVAVVDANTITGVMTVPVSVAKGTYNLAMESPGNRADMDFGRTRSCLCLTVADPLPAGDLVDMGAAVGISGPDTPTTNLSVDDFNGDTYPDILHLRHGATNVLLLGNGTGVVPVEIMPLASADRHECDSADVNGDGLIDIYCSVGAQEGSGIGYNSLWLRRPDGGYTDVAAAWGVTDPYGRGRYVTFLHANNDQWPDLYVGNTPLRTDEHVSENHLFLNDGGTGFLPAPEFGVDGAVGSRCVVSTDFDNDGDDDLVVCGDDRVHMFANQGGSGFIDVALANGFPQRFMGAAFADIDGDGDVDVAFSTATSFAIHRLQNGIDVGNVFSYPATLGHNVAFGNINGDNKPDAYFVQPCATTGGANLPDIVAVSNGASWVAKSPPALTRGCGDAVVAFDHDDDGIDGFVVANGRGKNGPLQYLVLPSPPGC